MKTPSLRATALIGASLVALITCSSGSPRLAAAQGSPAAIMQKFRGVWELLPFGAYVLRPDGSKLFTLGPAAEGRLIVTGDQRWIATFQNPDRPLCAINAQANCTAAEVYPAIWRGGIFYTAIAYVDDVAGNTLESGRVLLDIDFSMFPNEVGTESWRDYRFDGTDRLTLERDSTLAPGSIVTIELARSAANVNGK